MGTREDLAQRLASASIPHEIEGATLVVRPRDARGFTAMHLAGMHGLGRIAQRLIDAGADRRPRDKLGRTPYDLALQHGYADVAAEFEPLRSAAPPLPRLARKE